MLRGRREILQASAGILLHRRDAAVAPHRVEHELGAVELHDRGGVRHVKGEVAERAAAVLLHLRVLSEVQHCLHHHGGAVEPTCGRDHRSHTTKLQGQPLGSGRTGRPGPQSKWHMMQCVAL